MIIDSDGRLFGKINIIDLALLLFIVIVVVVGIRFFLNSTIENEEEVIEIEVKVSNRKDWFADAITRGDREIVGDKVTVVITEKEVDPVKLCVVGGNGINKINSTLFYEMSDVNDVTLKVKVLAEKRGDGMYFKGEEMKIGQKITISLNHIDIKGVVTKIY